LPQADLHDERIGAGFGLPQDVFARRSPDVDVTSSEPGD
jgi:hypothetical protein